MAFCALLKKKYRSPRRRRANICAYLPYYNAVWQTPFLWPTKNSAARGAPLRNCRSYGLFVGELAVDVILADAFNKAVYLLYALSVVHDSLLHAFQVNETCLFSLLPHHVHEDRFIGTDEINKTADAFENDPFKDCIADVVRGARPSAGFAVRTDIVLLFFRKELRCAELQLRTTVVTIQ